MEKMKTKELKGYNGIFAERFRNLMYDTKTKQAELAGELGVTRQAISTYMDGSASPNLEKFKKICEIFKVSSDYMLGLSNSNSLVTEERNCSDMTGLNTNSIQVLNYFNTSECEKEQIIIMLLNKILKSKNSLLQLSKKIISCYKSYIKEHSLNDTLFQNENDKMGDFDYKTNSFLACDWFDEPIEDVVLDLCERKEIPNAKTNK